MHGIGHVPDVFGTLSIDTKDNGSPISQILKNIEGIYFGADTYKPLEYLMVAVLCGWSGECDR